MKKSLFAVAAMAVMGLGFVACEDDLIGDPCDLVTPLCASNQMCRVNPSTNEASCKPDCSKIESADELVWSWENGGACINANVEECADDNECEEGYICNSNNMCEEGAPKFKYVRIDDLSPAETSATKEDPGVDIDAVVLVKQGSGGTHYATRVAGYRRGDGDSTLKDNFAFDPQAAVGKPDSFVSYPTNTDTCHYYVNPQAAKKQYTFVSLGGVGGYLILEMGAVIETGDKLDVLEVSDCKLANTISSNGQTAVKEPEGFRVQISVSEKADGKWNFVNQGQVTKGILSTTISNSMLSL